MQHTQPGYSAVPLTTYACPASVGSCFIVTEGEPEAASECKSARKPGQAIVLGRSGEGDPTTTEGVMALASESKQRTITDAFHRCPQLLEVIICPRAGTSFGHSGQKRKRKQM